METFTKLFSSIIHSTVWREPNHVRLVWVTMLALADRDGYVGASVPGLADAARVTLEECVDALDRFQKPDTWSRSQEHEGRRIEVVDRGFNLLNYKRFREKRDEIARQEQNAEAQARWRENHPEEAKKGRKGRKQRKPASAHAESDQSQIREEKSAPPLDSPDKIDPRQPWLRLWDEWCAVVHHGMPGGSPDRHALDACVAVLEARGGLDRFRPALTAWLAARKSPTPPRLSYFAGDLAGLLDAPAPKAEPVPKSRRVLS